VVAGNLSACCPELWLVLSGLEEEGQVLHEVPPQFKVGLQCLRRSRWGCTPGADMQDGCRQYFGTNMKVAQAALNANPGAQLATRVHDAQQLDASTAAVHAAMHHCTHPGCTGSAMPYGQLPAHVLVCQIQWQHHPAS
jgi:hypothetical protein